MIYTVSSGMLNSTILYLYFAVLIFHDFTYKINVVPLFFAMATMSQLEVFNTDNELQ